MDITPRQKEVATLLAAGLSNKEIGGQLGMATRTVKAHLWRLAARNGIERVNRVKVARLYTGNVHPLPEMSPRKTEIARLVIEGLSNKEIGARINITESAVKNRLRIIYDEMGVWSRLELAARYA